jgi:hypothetical protein
VDESRLPPGERAKVRCPHCKEISSIGDLTKQPGRPASPGVTAEVAGEKKNVSRGKAMDHEPTFPKDAFENFRFPAETEAKEFPKKPRRSLLKAIIWIGVSLAIIGFFALLVNLVLPGPYGSRPFGWSGKSEQTPAKMPAGSERPDPYSVRPGVGR